MLAHDFVHLLPIRSCFHGGHQQTFSRREGAIAGEVARNGPLVNHETGDQFLRGAQELVGAEKSLGQDHAPVG